MICFVSNLRHTGLIWFLLYYDLFVLIWSRTGWFDLCNLQLLFDWENCENHALTFSVHTDSSKLEKFSESCDWIWVAIASMGNTSNCLLLFFILCMLLVSAMASGSWVIHQPTEADADRGGRLALSTRSWSSNTIPNDPKALFHTFFEAPIWSF